MTKIRIYTASKRNITVIMATTALMVLSACSSVGTSAQGVSDTSSSQSTADSPSVTAEQSAAEGSTDESTAAPGSAIAVPSSALLKPGALSVCSYLTSPPIEFYTADNQPTGSDVELGNAMAMKMGLTADWINTAFNGIIPALQAQRCDVIMSQLYIKPEREAVVDFVPYMYSGSTFMVKKDNALTITSAADLCGKKAAAETGTTVIDFLQEHSKECTNAGKPAIDIRQFADDASALQQLKIGLVDAYGTTVETAAYDIEQNNGEFVTVGEPFNRIKVGAATRKGDTVLHNALQQALDAIHGDGQYEAIMAKWGLKDDILAAGD